jgi:8-oxo-dGTP pyrophosphatase MutT (NUDIX family)
MKSAGAIVFRRENNEIKYLLIKYGWGHWEFPRGGIEKGENLEETARREIKEETGIEDVNFIKGFKEWIKFFLKQEGENIMKIAIFLLAETKTKEIRLSHEHDDYLWLNYEDALEKLTFDDSKKVIEKAHNFLSKNE